MVPLLLIGCSGLQKVERRQGDHVELGRSVSPRAYAWYARARYLHRSGELDLARQAYRGVLAEDPRSGAAYAGLASTYCETDRDEARDIFARGLRHADEVVPIYLDRGRCELTWKQPKSALASANQAFSRDPASREVSDLLAAALTALGREEEALRVLRAERLYSREGAPNRPSAPGPRAVDDALARGDLAVAEALSLEVMTRTTLAVRALALGQSEFAEEQAALVVAASPDDAVAWMVLGLTREEPIEPPPAPDAGPLVTCLWAEHLRKRVGLPAFLAFVSAVSRAEPSRVLQDWQTEGDPLLAACAKRLERISQPSGEVPAPVRGRGGGHFARYPEGMLAALPFSSGASQR